MAEVYTNLANKIIIITFLAFLFEIVRGALLKIQYLFQHIENRFSELITIMNYQTKIRVI